MAAAAKRPKATNCQEIGVAGGRLRVFAMRRPKPEGYTLVNTTSGAKTPMERGLSPFNLGPVELYDGTTATNVENLWQFAKVYSCHADPSQTPTEAYWRWARDGWNDPKPRRFPMGRGAKPLYSLWAGRRLGYIDARTLIYAPVYAAAVEKTASYAWLRALYDTGGPIGLVDFDGWDHVGQGFTLREVLASPTPKMGHAFVLAGLLTGDRFWLPGPAVGPAPLPVEAVVEAREALTDEELAAVLAPWT